jgi:hypothetical protein
MGVAAVVVVVWCVVVSLMFFCCFLLCFGIFFSIIYGGGIEMVGRNGCCGGLEWINLCLFFVQGNYDFLCGEEVGSTKIHACALPSPPLVPPLTDGDGDSDDGDELVGGSS